MGERVRNTGGSGGNYFAAPKSGIEFIPTGCKILDLALGGGWAEGRVGNVVGDKSTGKTLLMIEAAANFAKKHPTGVIKYREAEAAFDQDYAGALGMPLDRVDFGEKQLATVEDFFEDLQLTVEEARKTKKPHLYILDSLDALSDREELDRDIDKGSFGASKAKKMSELFRRNVRDVEEVGVTLLIVSQIRDNMNAMAFGKKTTRSGGRALDFYASQVLFLAQIKRVTKTVKKVTRPVGIVVKAKLEKNKVGLPFREAQFQITFGYGIEDELACEDWLKEVASPIPEGNLKVLHKAVEKRWYEIEQSFLPKRKKYGDD